MREAVCAETSRPEPPEAKLRDPSRSNRIGVLPARRDFLAAAGKGWRWGGRSLLLQGRRRATGDASDTPVRVGFTCSKKVGNAVARNRAKRRLRAAAAEVLPRLARDGWDYVLIGSRDNTANRDFLDLVRDVEAGLNAVHACADENRPIQPHRRRRKRG